MNKIRKSPDPKKDRGTRPERRKPPQFQTAAIMAVI